MNTNTREDVDHSVTPAELLYHQEGITGILHCLGPLSGAGFVWSFFLPLVFFSNRSAYRLSTCNVVTLNDYESRCRDRVTLVLSVRIYALKRFRHFPGDRSPRHLSMMVGLLLTIGCIVARSHFPKLK